MKIGTTLILFTASGTGSPKSHRHNRNEGGDDGDNMLSIHFSGSTGV
jgi:hypothetical protein